MSPIGPIVPDRLRPIEIPGAPTLNRRHCRRRHCRPAPTDDGAIPKVESRERTRHPPDSAASLLWAKTPGPPSSYDNHANFENGSTAQPPFSTHRHCLIYHLKGCLESKAENGVNNVIATALYPPTYELTMVDTSVENDGVSPKRTKSAPTVDLVPTAPQFPWSSTLGSA